MYVCMYVCMCACMYLCTYVTMYEHTCMCVCVYVCMCKFCMYFSYLNKSSGHHSIDIQFYIHK